MPTPRCTRRRSSLRSTRRCSAGASGRRASEASLSIDGNATLGSNAVSSRVFGSAVGADYRFSPFTTAGFALAGGGTNYGLANGLGSGHSDLFQAGAFVRHTVGPAYILAAIAYGWQDVTTDRTVMLAGTDRVARTLPVQHALRTDRGRLSVPDAMDGDHALCRRAAHDHQPAGLCRTGSGRHARLRAGVWGQRCDVPAQRTRPARRQVVRGAGCGPDRARPAAWAHDYYVDRNIAATFQALPVSSFIVNGAAQAQDLALLSASAELKWVSGWSVAGVFDGEFSNVTRSYSGKGVVRYAW